MLYVSFLDHPMPEELDKPGVDNNQLEDCDRVSEFERIIYRQGFAISYGFSI